MPNWRKIGNDFEKKIQGYLEDAGLLVEQAKPQLVWAFIKGKRIPITKAYDFFGVFDLISLNLRRAPFVWLLQVTVGGQPRNSERRSKIKKFLKEHPTDGPVVQLWTRCKNKRDIRIETFHGSGEVLSDQTVNTRTASLYFLRGLIWGSNR